MFGAGFGTNLRYTVQQSSQKVLFLTNKAKHEDNSEMKKSIWLKAAFLMCWITFPAALEKQQMKKYI